MSTLKIEVEVPEALTAYVNINDPDFQRKIKEFMIFELVRDGIISFGKAAEILETDQYSLVAKLGKQGIPYFDSDIEDIAEDATTANILSKGKQ